MSGRRGCGPVEPFIARAVHDPGLLVRRCMVYRDFAVDRPDEGRQLAGDRSDDDVGRLPFRASVRKRPQSLICAFQAISRAALGAAPFPTFMSLLTRGGR